MTARELVDRLGGDVAAALDLDLECDDDTDRWFIAACLLASRAREPVAIAAFRALDRARLASPTALASAGPEAAAQLLADADYPHPEATAVKLARAGAALEASGAQQLRRLGDEADDLEDLGGRLARLAPGIGRAAVLTFLRPLRELWPAARETPTSPAARAAAVHLGFISPGADDEGEPGALRAALAREADAPALAAVEAALDTLGRRACLREREARCPIPDACPLPGRDVAHGEPRQ